jgi:hypothetical protein
MTGSRLIALLLAACALAATALIAIPVESFEGLGPTQPLAAPAPGARPAAAPAEAAVPEAADHAAVPRLWLR